MLSLWSAYGHIWKLNTCNKMNSQDIIWNFVIIFFQEKLGGRVTSILDQDHPRAIRAMVQEQVQVQTGPCTTEVQDQDPRKNRMRVMEEETHQATEDLSEAPGSSWSVPIFFLRPYEHRPAPACNCIFVLI